MNGKAENVFSLWRSLAVGNLNKQSKLTPPIINHRQAHPLTLDIALGRAQRGFHDLLINCILQFNHIRKAQITGNAVKALTDYTSGMRETKEVSVKEEETVSHWV